MAFTEKPAQNLDEENGASQAHQKSREAPTYRIKWSQLLGLGFRVHA